METNEKNYVIDEETGELTFFDGRDTGVVLTRERIPSQKLKKMIWIYYVKGSFNGSEVKANFAPGGKDDISTFINLDLIFGGGSTAPIYEVKTTRTGNDGEKKTSITYKVVGRDEFGEEFSAEVRPQKKSDAAVFDYLCRRAKKLAELEAAKAAQTADGGDVTPETPPVEKPEKKNKS